MGSFSIWHWLIVAAVVYVIWRAISRGRRGAEPERATLGYGRAQSDDRGDDATPSGSYDVEVVGESHYQEALGIVAGPKDKDEANVEVEAQLAPEPTNPHDRHAVAVRIQGHLVGYLPRQSARAFHTWAKRSGARMPITCPALITGGWKRRDSEGSYGVLLDFPPLV